MEIFLEREKKVIKPIEDDPKVQRVIRKYHERKTIDIYRKAFSELNLLQDFKEPLKPGYSYHVISGGDVDALSFLKIILNDQPLDYLLFSTWCMAADDVMQIDEWIKAGRIKEIDAYVGEISPNTYRNVYNGLKKVITGRGRIAVFRNHSKIFAGTGPKYQFAIESSANINTNPRTENTAITVAEDIFIFYKDFFDGIKSFTGDDKAWKPWKYVKNPIGVKV